MPVKNVRFYTFALIFTDIMAIMGAFAFAYYVRTKLDSRPLLYQTNSGEDFLLSFVALIPFWFITFWGLGLYRPAIYQRRLTEFGRLGLGSFAGILIVLGYAFVIDRPVFPARLIAIYALILMFVLLVIGRELLRQLRDALYKTGYGVQRVMIIGNGEATQDIANALHNSKDSGLEVVAVVSTKRSSINAVSFRSLSNALSQLKSLKIDTIIQTELYEDTTKNRQIMGTAQDNNIQYCFVPGQAEFYSGKNHVDVFLGYPLINVYQTPLVGWGELAKRVFDLCVVVLTTPLWGSLLVITAVAQKIFNPGPVFYKSPRLTRYSKKFYLLKFRSMGAQYGKVDASEEFEAMGRHDLAVEYKTTRKIANDPRITKFGRFLRATSLDEIPQILNVLVGHISLVGPRPILPQELHLYKGQGSLLHSVKSGLTGLWQVSGRSNLSFGKRVELELYYAQNWSFWLDVKILFKTVGVVLFGKGAK